MSRLSTSSMPSPHEALYKSAQDFTTSTSSQTHLEAHRERFRARLVSSSIADGNPLAVPYEKDQQKIYFRNLKFKYLEQEAKRSFLFSITGDEPQRVMPGENEELEAENKVKKAKLKHVKDEIEGMRSEAIALAKTNAEYHAKNAAAASEATLLSRQIRDMELELARIKAAHPEETRMTVDEANDRLDAQTEELERLTSEITAAGPRGDQLRSVVAERSKKVLALARDREVHEARAEDVRRSREKGGSGVRVHEMSLWYESTLNAYRNLMGIRSARVVSPSQLVLEYDTTLPGSPTGVAQLTLLFDAQQRLIDAVLTGAGAGEVDGEAEPDIREACATAVDRNDAAGLIADVLVRLRPL